MHSPWGKIDNTEKTNVRGVTFVSTVSHGGYRVTRLASLAMHPALFDLGIDYGPDYLWFEEDCNYVAVLLTWPSIVATDLPASVVRATYLKSLRHWNPEAFKALYTS